MIGAKEAVCSPDAAASTASQFRRKGYHCLPGTMSNNSSFGPIALFFIFYLFCPLFVFVSLHFWLRADTRVKERVFSSPFIHLPQLDPTMLALPSSSRG